MIAKKRNVFTLIILLFGTLGFSQIEHPKASPFSKVEQEVGLSKFSIEYSRPAVKGRTIFAENGLVPYGRIWRVGANESTKFSVDTDVEILGSKLRKGTYALYAFPHESEWEIVFHTNISHWGDGRRNYDPEEDAFRIKLVPETSEEFQENFLIAFDSITHESANMVWYWANTKITVPIQVDTHAQMLTEIERQLKENPSAQTYYESARYLQEQGKEYSIALKYLEKAIVLGGDTYFFYRVKSLVEAALGDYPSAIKSAEKSLELAAKEEKDEFVRMNKKNIIIWKEKTEIEMRHLIALLVFVLIFSCRETKSVEQDAPVLWQSYNDSAEVAANADHEKKRMRYKFIQSRVLDKNKVFRPLYHEVSKFSQEHYERMKPLVLEQDIPTIQDHVRDKKFSYEDLVLFYLHRINKYELPNETTLNTVIALNQNVLEQARRLNPNSEGQHPIYGMPILLKDNIGTRAMKTTAGAIALMDNEVDDAFIVKRLKEKGALILGKVNLSEWANFLCECPNGQSAIGGQTLNPYGRRIFDTGGSSAGSGTSVAANYAVAAVGTETSGSILSPSGQNSVVGLKPTIGLLSRSGIVPISSTLDTPGPMTRNVMDNAILLSAMLGHDERDSKSVKKEFPGILSAGWHPIPFEEMRLGALISLMENDSLYARTIRELENLGAEIVKIDSQNIDMEGFFEHFEHRYEKRSAQVYRYRGQE